MPSLATNSRGSIQAEAFSDALRDARLAKFLLMQRAFDLGYRRYEWKCDALNTASRTAAQRLEISFEGVFRKATVYKHRKRDTAWYAAIDTEWPTLRAAFQTWLAPSNFNAQVQQRIRLTNLTRPILKQPVGIV